MKASIKQERWADLVKRIEKLRETGLAVVVFFEHAMQHRDHEDAPPVPGKPIQVIIHKDADEDGVLQAIVKAEKQLIEYQELREHRKNSPVLFEYMKANL